MLIKLSVLNNKYNLDITGVSHFGAHLGQEVPSYQDLDINNIYLFEPQKKIFDELEIKFSEENNIKLFNFGLGSENKFVDLNLAPGNSGLSSSILKPGKHKNYYPDIEFAGSEKIKICIYDDLNIKNVNFLNIDIQGYEMEALKGCVKVLENEIDYIFIEISRKPLYEGSALVKDIDNFLNDFKFIRVKTKWASSKVPWADALYIKKDKVNFHKLFIANLHKFFEKFSIYYIFIDPYRKYQKIKYKLKQRVKNFLS